MGKGYNRTRLQVPGASAVQVPRRHAYGCSPVGSGAPDPAQPCSCPAPVKLCRRPQFRVHLDGCRLARRTAARTLCKISLRTASGPEGSSAKQSLSCAAGHPGRGGARDLAVVSQLQHSSHSPVAYQVIARKWRPQRFEDVVGQQAVTQTLAQRARQRPARAGVRLCRRARRRQDHDRAHPGAGAELRERARRPIPAANATPAWRSPRAAISTSSKSTPPATPASTTSAR